MGKRSFLRIRLQQCLLSFTLTILCHTAVAAGAANLLAEHVKRWANAPNLTTRRAEQQALLDSGLLQKEFAGDPAAGQYRLRPVVLLQTTAQTQTRIVAQARSGTGQPGFDLPTPPPLLLSQVKTPTIIHFWANWCSPCRRELPLLKAFYVQEAAALAALGLNLIAVNADPDYGAENDAELSQILQQLPAAHDPKFLLYRQLARREAVALPATFLLLPNGRTRPLAYGPVAWQTPGLTAQLAQILQRLIEQAPPELSAALQPPTKGNSS